MQGRGGSGGGGGRGGGGGLWQWQCGMTALMAPQTTTNRRPNRQPQEVDLPEGERKALVAEEGQIFKRHGLPHSGPVDVVGVRALARGRPPAPACPPCRAGARFHACMRASARICVRASSCVGKCRGSFANGLGRRQ